MRYLVSDRCSSVSLRSVTFVDQYAFYGKYPDLPIRMIVLVWWDACVAYDCLMLSLNAIIVCIL